MKSVSLAAGDLNPLLENPNLTFTRRWNLSWFWIGLALIVILAAVPRLLSYQFSLPYVDHPDEPNWYLSAVEWRSTFESYRAYAGDPPAYIALHLVVQTILEALGQPGLSATVHVLRFVSLAANLLTIVFVALTARRAADAFAGLIAGLAWAVMPLLLENGVYALPDPLIYMLISLTLWLAVEALLNPKRGHWSIWSFAVGLLAILVKYPVASAIAPGGLAALALLRDRRRGLRYLLLQVGLLLATIAWLLLGYGLDISRLGREGATARDDGLGNLLNPERLINNLHYATVPLHSTVFWLIVGLGTLAYVVTLWRGQRRVHGGIVALCLVMFVSIPWLASTFSLVSLTERLRDVLPATTIACTILGIAAAQITFIMPRRYAPVGRGILLGALALLVFVPQVADSWQLAQSRSLPDRRVALRQWADINLDPGTFLVTSDNHKTFNPYWGGLTGRKWFDWREGNITSETVDEWHDEQGISYAAIPIYRLEDMRDSADGQTQLAEMLHLRDFHGGPPARGPEFEVYRLYRMQHEVEAAFGDAIHLIGYDQSADRFAAGENVELRFYWQAASTPAANYSLFIHLTALDNRDVLAQADGAPAVLERPTLTWDAPDETIISQAFTLALPSDLPDGDYRLLVGLYDYLTGERLPVSSDLLDSLGDALILGGIDVSD
ncbi:MAG: glycosyltransferase family 39 protein [Burkholderiales bacterium]|nr:glycosyltransferase family 39 protein [Anaerolineae bacterium]